MKLYRCLKAGFLGFFLAIGAAVSVAIVAPVLIVACVFGSPVLGFVYAIAAFFEKPKPELHLRRMNGSGLIDGLRFTRAQKEIIPETN